MEKIIVIGANGQLGHCLQKLEARFPKFKFIFTTSEDLDITQEGEVLDFFEEIKPKYCINASAYTAVDLAEKEAEKAFAVNSNGVSFLAKASFLYKTTLVHVSTDYVFDGETNLDYSEDDWTSPIGIYGQSKLLGEEKALEENPSTIILRTSWLYSEFGKNFVKTMLNLFSTKEEIGVVADQYGQPTNANDLAEAIMKIISSDPKKFGVYHFSNYGETTWYQFAQEIAQLTHSGIKINSLTTEQYPTPAKRPKRSTLCLDKIEKDYGIKPKYWQNSLEEVIHTLQTQS